MRPLILGDISRCLGDNHPNCIDCLRRLQIERDHADTSERWYPYMQGRGSGCNFKISEAKDE